MRYNDGRLSTGATLAVVVGNIWNGLPLSGAQRTNTVRRETSTDYDCKGSSRELHSSRDT